MHSGRAIAWYWEDGDETTLALDFVVLDDQVSVHETEPPCSERYGAVEYRVNARTEDDRLNIEFPHNGSAAVYRASQRVSFSAVWTGKYEGEFETLFLRGVVEPGDDQLVLEIPRGSGIALGSSAP